MCIAPETICLVTTKVLVPYIQTTNEACSTVDHYNFTVIPIIDSTGEEENLGSPIGHDLNTRLLHFPQECLR
ncbi:hypothetical protein D1872_321070 [compost metagenome]